MTSAFPLHRDTYQDYVSREEEARRATSSLPEKLWPWRVAHTPPRVIVEVTSDSSEDYDYGEKLTHYTQVPSLEAVNACPACTQPALPAR